MPEPREETAQPAADALLMVRVGSAPADATLVSAASRERRRAVVGGTESPPISGDEQAARGIFASTPVEDKKSRTELLVQVILFIVTAMLVAPLVAILSYLLIKAWPALSWSFIFENPQNYMTAGGIWAPIVGTFYLVFFSLLVAAPIGILAGVYLNEYARARA